MSAAGERDPVPIDLGMMSPSTAPDGSLRAPDGPFPAPDLPRPPLWNPSRRRAAMTAVIVAAVSVLGASSVGGARQAMSLPAPIPPPVTVAATGEPLAVVGDSVYTTTAGADGGRLTAYSLQTGRPRWSVATPSAGQLSLVGAGSHLLLTSRPTAGPMPASRYDPDRTWTAGLDARTGTIGWRHTGVPLWVAPGDDRVAIQAIEWTAGSANSAGPGDPATVGRTVVAVLNVATGADVAVFGPIGPDRSMSPVLSTDSVDRWLTGEFVREDRNGGQLFDFASAGTRHFDLPLAAPPPSIAVGGYSPYEAVVMAGDLIVTTTGWGGRVVLTGNSGDPPRPRWTVPDLSVYKAWRCGAILCASALETSFALDPGTGEIRWRSPGGLLWRASAGRLYSSVLVSSAGRLDSNRGTGLAVLDQATGRQLLRQDEWRPVTLVEGPRIPFLSYTRAGGVLAVLDARTLATERLAVLPLNQADCVAGGAYVACRTGEHTIRAWRYSA